MKLKINEIFEDIEGEGIFRGFGTLFIRFSGCNLRCVWCDTKTSYNRGAYVETADLMRIIKKSPYKRISITGGEPLEQKEGLVMLINEVKKKFPGKIICVETNGSRNIAGIKADCISMDIKPPSSGVHKEMDVMNLKRLRKKDQVKITAASEEDMEYARKILQKYGTKASVSVQPVFGRLGVKKIGGFIMKKSLDWSAGIQLHKIQGGTRGLKRTVEIPGVRQN
ncbi:MAG TPA: radical SAM protein [Firmicutes bacterium]|nr:radical SAM protein [Bacillota bacterium]